MATNTERTVYIIELKDKFTRGIASAEKTTKRYNTAVDKAKTKTKGLSDSFKVLKTAAAALAVAGIGRVVKSVADLVGKFQEVRVAFNVMLGSKGLGGDMMAWAKEFSRATVITFDQTVTSIRKLLAYGISGQNAKPLTEMLSTIAAGVGTDRLPYLTLALGQVFSRGRLMGTELRQFREHGVDIVSEVAKGIGKKTSEVEKMVTDGLVSFDMVAESMMKMTQEGGRFHGMLEEAAKKWKGSVAILTSTFQILTVEFFEPFVDEMTNVVRSLTDSLQELREVDFAPFQKAFLDSWKNILAAQGQANDPMLKVAQLMSVITEVFTAFYDGLKTSITVMGDLFLGVINYMRGHVISALEGIGLGPGGGDFIKTDAKYMMSGGIAAHLQGFLDRRKSAMDAIYNMGKKTLPEMVTPGLVPTSTDQGDLTGGKSTGGRTGRAVGTGARDIIINIGNLVENMNNYGMNDDEQQKFKAQMVQALATVVNDVSLITQR